MRVLILGGTTEASELARQLSARPNLEVETSFAGRTTGPRAAAGRTRVGGFGGEAGLAAYLRSAGVDILIDATHPLAKRMRWNAFDAASAVGIPRLRVERPPWTAGPGDRWTAVGDLRAASEIARRYSRVLLTTGRIELEPFTQCVHTWFLIRSIEPPVPQPLRDALVVLDRGPFTEAGERALLIEHQIDLIVTKNSGGDATVAKLAAARELGLPVAMVERPPNPRGAIVETVAEAMIWTGQRVEEFGG